MKVMVTGGTGFIGQELIGRLLGQGDVVRALVRRETLADAGKRSRLSENVIPIAGSLTDRDSLRRAAAGAEVVYHLATIRSSDSRALAAVNVRGTEDVLRACACSGVRRIVFSSSVAVYGWRDLPREWPISEDAPTEWRGPYARSKIAAENLIRRQHRDWGLEYVVLRLPIVYGVGAPIFDDFIRESLARPAMVAGWGGELVYQPIHVRDAADALTLAGTVSRARAITVNAAGGELVSNRRLVAMALATAAGEPARVRPPRWSKSARLQFDIRQAQQILGFLPRVRLEQGLPEVVAQIAKEEAIPRITASPTRPWR